MLLTMQISTVGIVWMNSMVEFSCRVSYRMLQMPEGSLELDSTCTSKASFVNEELEIKCPSHDNVT